MGIKKELIKRFKKVVSQKSIISVPVIKSDLLYGKTALITGGTSGIGLAIAKAFLQNGATVVIAGRTNDKVNSIVNSIKQEQKKENVYGVCLDVTIPSLFNDKLEETLALVNKIDILVNSAGVLSHNKFGNVTEENWDSVINTNLKGMYFLSQTISKYMIDNSIPGNILQVGSSSCLRPAISPYTCSKWGVRGFTLGLAKELAPFGIVVNGIAPGPTATPMLSKSNDDVNDPSIPAERFVSTDEIANMAVFLVSSAGRMIVGDMVYMTGGSGLITYDDMEYSYNNKRMPEYSWGNESK